MYMGQHCIGLLHWTTAPFTVRLCTMLLCLLICLHPPSPLYLARRLRSIMCTLLLDRVYLLVLSPWPQPCYDRIRVILKCSCTSKTANIHHFIRFVIYCIITTCSVECYWHCSEETVHYKSDKMVNFCGFRCAATSPITVYIKFVFYIYHLYNHQDGVLRQLCCLGCCHVHLESWWMTQMTWLASWTEKLPTILPSSRILGATEQGEGGASTVDHVWP